MSEIIEAIDNLLLDCQEIDFRQYCSKTESEDYYYYKGRKEALYHAAKILECAWKKAPENQ